MSDQPHTSGWWKASDGKWYPPETHPDYRPPPPPPSSPAPTAPPMQPSQQWVAASGPVAPPKSSRNGCLVGALVGVAVLGFAIAVLAVALVAANDADDESPTVGATALMQDQSSEASGESDEVDDVGPCIMVDEDTITLEVANNSSKQSTYIIDVNFLDAAGQRVGDESFFVNHLRSGVRAVEDRYVFDSAGGTDCEIAEVDRFAAESPDDVTEVSCEITGVDAFGDIEVSLRAENGSSRVSDYFINAGLMRGEVRIGSIIGSIENVRPGESAPGDGFSTVDGPADGVRCETIHVQRTASD
ncbi:MAG: hypothetical protein ACR2QE_04935 [Acidimicrobiales bacterium]